MLHQSGRGTPPDEAVSGGNDSLYCFNFLTQRDHGEPGEGVARPAPASPSVHLRDAVLRPWHAVRADGKKVLHT
jgi:hypothetical protein